MTGATPGRRQILGRRQIPSRPRPRQRALLAYSSYLGHGQLAHSTPGFLPATRAARRAYLDDTIRALTSR